MAYIEGTNAVAPGDPIGVRINGRPCRGAVVHFMSRDKIIVATPERRIEVDLRPCNEAVWDKARRFIAEQAGVELEAGPTWWGD
jgi:hypothetical protein